MRMGIGMFSVRLSDLPSLIVADRPIGFFAGAPVKIDKNGEDKGKKKSEKEEDDKKGKN